MGRAMSNSGVIRTYHENGNICYEHYYLNEKHHREDGPAYISYHENGNVWFEYYYINGKLHREDGPAYIDNFGNENIKYEEYFINGIKLTKEEWYSKLTAKQKVNLLYGKGNE
jgi:hypothetical protein